MQVVTTFFILLLSVLFVVGANAQSDVQWKDSLEVLNRQIELVPDSVDLRLKKAAVNIELGQWQYAAEECTIILQNIPDDLGALFYRAYAYNMLRRYDLARTDYEEFLRIVPTHLEARIGLAHTLIKLKRVADAMSELNILVEQYPNDDIVYVAKATVEREQGFLDAALMDYEEAIRITPRADYYVSAADILITQGKMEEARTMLDRAVSNGTPRGALKEWYEKTKN